jgi:hypothetical protein
VAENFPDLHVDERPKPRGRRLAIKDAPLWRVRDHLVWLIEVTWAEIGGELPKIRTPGDVLATFQVWKDKSTEHVTTTLLRPSSIPASSKVLNRMRRELEKLNERVQSAYQFMEGCSASFEQAFRISTAASSEGQQAIIDDQLRKRVEALVRAGKEYEDLRSRQQSTEARLKDCEAYFARSEVVDFCLSERYRIKPIHVANALAGLPLIGWRQSTKRCSKRPCPGLNGLSMQVFEAIRRVTNGCARRSELISYAEQWLTARRGTKSLAVSQLRNDWFYFRWAMKAVLETASRGRDLPFAIAREYWKRKLQASPTDRLFAGEERIQ